MLDDDDGRTEPKGSGELKDNQISRVLHRLISLPYHTSHTYRLLKCDFALNLYF